MFVPACLSFRRRAVFLLAAVSCACISIALYLYRDSEQTRFSYMRTLYPCTGVPREQQASAIKRLGLVVWACCVGLLCRLADDAVHFLHFTPCNMLCSASRFKSQLYLEVLSLVCACAQALPSARCSESRQCVQEVKPDILGHVQAVSYQTQRTHADLLAGIRRRLVSDKGRRCALLSFPVRQQAAHKAC